MKKITKKMWIEMGIICGISLLLSLLFYYLNVAKILPFEGSYIVTTIGFVLIFLGWIGGNHIEYSYRRKNKEYGAILPDDIKRQRFSYRFPLMMSGLIALILSVIFYYI